MEGSAARSEPEQPMTYILGLNAFRNDSAACLLRDGRLIAAAEEERFRRIKHWAGYPCDAIRYCLAEAGIEPDVIDLVAFSCDRADGMSQQRLREELADTGFECAVQAVDLPRALLAAAFLVSPFDEAVVVAPGSIGQGAFWGAGRGTQIEVDASLCLPDSLGLFYRAITRFLGFPRAGDEYKVMGLAPYGSPVLLPEMRRIVRLLDDGRFSVDPAVLGDGPGGSEESMAAGLQALFGPPRRADEALTLRHRDIAHSAQAMYEEALFHLLDALHARYRCDAVAVAGDGGLNSVANGRLRARTAFRHVYVPPAPGDAGAAMGAALVAWHEHDSDASRARTPALDQAAWGPAFSDADIARALDDAADRIRLAGCARVFMSDVGALCRRTAADLADGRVVGWFHGRMEWGPRALGGRSILGDPRRADMKAILNLKIKRRESFRPFAPSVLREAVADWFEQDGDVPFMSQVLQIRADRRARIPAVTHVDGSGRLQTVEQQANPHYHALISAFRDLTGVPMILNTSFNENEPVVCRPEEALACFMRTQMDVLVMGRWMLRR